MVSKLSSLAISKQIPKWASLNSFISSISSLPNIQTQSETNQNPEFEPKFQTLFKNKLSPENLIKVLDSTQDLNTSLEIFKWASQQKRFYHTADTYFWIILRLGMIGNVEKMESFCSQMVKERCPHLEEAFSALIDRFVKSGRLEEALRVLGIMNSSTCRPTIGLCNVLTCTMLEERRDFKSVLFAYKEIVKAGIAPNVETLNYLIEVLCKEGRIDSALGQFRRMNKKGCCPNSRTFEMIICGLCKSNRVDECVVVLGELYELKCSMDLSFLSNVIPLLCRVNRPDEGIRLLKMMTDSGVSPDQSIYGVLVGSLCENSQVDNAVQVLEEMIEHGVVPMVDVYVDIVNGYCRLLEFDDAANFLKESFISETLPQNALLDGYCNACRFHEANALLDKMVMMNEADNVSWSILIRAVCEIGEIRKAFEILSRMITNMYIPDCTIYSSLIFGHCQNKEYDDALELFGQVHVRDWPLDCSSYAELIKGLCHVKRIQEATDVFRYMSRKGHATKSSSLDLLIEGISLMGNFHEAIELYALACNAGTSCSPVTHNAILLKLYELGRTKDVLVFLSRMLIIGFGLSAEAYGLLIHSLCAENKVNNCAHLLDRMVGDGLFPNSETLDKLLSCMACHSQLHMVMPTLHKLACIDGVLSLHMYNMLIDGLLKEGRRRDADQLLDRMLEKGWVPDAATHSMLIRSSGDEEGSGIAEKIQDSKVHDEVSSILAQEFEEI